MNTDTRLTVVFPMAGRGDGFGGGFKPFTTIGNKTFIELALQSFSPWLSCIKEVIFIFLDEQEKEYQVTSRLKKLFPPLFYRCIILKNATNGPVETMRNAIEQDGRITGKVIVCDSDHYVDMEPVFHYLLEGNEEDCIVPLWVLRGEDIGAWSVASLSDEYDVTAIAEKELPSAAGNFFGVIGAYFFRDASFLVSNKQYISEVAQDLIKKGKKVKGVRVVNAEFFGDPQRLQNVIDTRTKQKGTIFCDLDGTLIAQEDAPDRKQKLTMLPGTIEKLREWSKRGYRLVLLTSRKPRDEKGLAASLQAASISYDHLITNISHGPKFLINDRDPSAMLVPHAIAFEVERNKGIAEIEIDSVRPNVLKMFRGGSLSRTLLVEKSGKIFVRKVVVKERSAHGKYLKLKQQCADLKKLSRFDGDLVPQIYHEEENSFEYYYDMEFLQGYTPLVRCSHSDKVRATKILLQRMNSRVYKPGAHVLESGERWLVNHFAEKIYPKLEGEKLPREMFSLVQAEKVVIDDKPYKGLLHLLKKSQEYPYRTELEPTHLCPIHGDLTFENILYKSNEPDSSSNSSEPRIKIIDTDCIDFVDPPELDLGKIFQSIVSQYEIWSAKADTLVQVNGTHNLALAYEPDFHLLNDLREYIPMWVGIIEGDARDIEKKGYFYMGLHLIRMIPFRIAASEDQALFALASAIKAITHSLDMVEATLPAGGGVSASWKT